MGVISLSRQWTEQPQEAVGFDSYWTSRKLLFSVNPATGSDGRKALSSNTTARVVTTSGLAMDIAGATKYATINASGHGITDQVTVCALISASSVGFYPMIISASSASGGDDQEGFELRLSASNGYPQMNVDEATTRVSATISTNIAGTGIRFLAGRYDGANVNVWLDNQKSSNAAGSGTIRIVNNTWTIGDRAGGTFPFTGQLIGLHIFASALSDSEIEFIRQNMWAVNEPRTQRIWTTAASSGLPTLSSATYVPGSLTASGFRPRVTATY